MLRSRCSARVCAASSLLCTRRFLAAGENLSKCLNNLMSDFGEARKLIAEAKESVGTPYYSDDASDAKQQTEKVIGDFNALKNSLKEDGQDEALRKVEREYDVKFAQLAAELADALEHDD